MLFYEIRVFVVKMTSERRGVCVFSAQKFDADMSTPSTPPNDDVHSHPSSPVALRMEKIDFGNFQIDHVAIDEFMATCNSDADSVQIALEFTSVFDRARTCYHLLCSSSIVDYVRPTYRPSFVRRSAVSLFLNTLQRGCSGRYGCR